MSTTIAPALWRGIAVGASTAGALGKHRNGMTLSKFTYKDNDGNTYVDEYIDGVYQGGHPGEPGIGAARRVVSAAQLKAACAQASGDVRLTPAYTT